MCLIIFKNKKNENVTIPVLEYHDFTTLLPESDPYDFEYINTPKSFEENIRVLLRHGFKPISFKDLYNALTRKKKLPKKPFIITFDDGYEGQYTLIYPIIKKYNIKVTMFVVTDLVGKRTDMAKYFGWDEAREMQSSGLVDICSHGKRHIAYDTIPIIQFKHEILQSFLLLDKNIGYNDLKIFAYPYGLYNQDMADILKQNGIDIQVTGLGLNNLNTIDFSNINRLNIPNNMTGEQIIRNNNL